MKADGPRLATANGANFTAEVAIPDAPDALYSIVVVSRRPGAAAGAAVTRRRRPSPA